MTSTAIPTDTQLRLSFSRVDTYQTCPLQYRFAYLDRLPAAPSPVLSWGSSIHAALETWWDQKLPEPPAAEVLLQALYDNWDDSGFEGMPREEKLRWYAWAQDVLRRHHEGYSAEYSPAVAVEEWFELDLGDDIEVVGSIDHVARTPSGGIGIVDWKTNRKAKPRHRVAGSLQLAIYTLAAVELWGQEPEWVALDFVVPGVRVVVGREEIDTDAALTEVIPITGMRSAPHLDFAGEVRAATGLPVFHAARISDVATARHAIASGSSFQPALWTMNQRPNRQVTAIGRAV
jgi:putative RecB family exonuclease